MLAFLPVISVFPANNHNIMNINLKQCKIIQFPKITDQRGNLTFIEQIKHIPFNIKRIYYLYDMREKARGKHAHKKLQQIIIAISGSFDVILDDGHNKKIFHLNRPNYGLYIPSMIWRELNNFSSAAICLVLASDYYNENDYIRGYDLFKKLIKE